MSPLDDTAIGQSVPDRCDPTNVLVVTGHFGLGKMAYCKACPAAASTSHT
jgi:hypothetical protein